MGARYHGGGDGSRSGACLKRVQPAADTIYGNGARDGRGAAPRVADRLSTGRTVMNWLDHLCTALAVLGLCTVHHLFAADHPAALNPEFLRGPGPSRTGGGRRPGDAAAEANFFSALPGARHSAWVQESAGATIVNVRPAPPGSPAVRAAGPTPTARWTAVVIHHSGTPSGCAAVFDRYHREERGWKDGLAYHFVIGNGQGSPDGRVEIGERWERRIPGPHCENPEFARNAVAICLVGNSDETPPTPKQRAALKRLVQWLQTEFHIPSDRVLSHRDVDRGRTACPGRLCNVRASALPPQSAERRP
ncbi:MAG: N-acetylmuramoyl-L-alanine amidase [Planctomycetes bacterium]|nr:N-acetylmuramoyl-L-alanine amidase [Planctomycetota bacterium]